jgi:hypothetical protein
MLFLRNKNNINASNIDKMGINMDLKKEELSP